MYIEEESVSDIAVGDSLRLAGGRWDVRLQPACVDSPALLL